MVNVGFIGKIDAIDSMVEAIRNFPEVHVAGKTSSGFLNRQEGLQYSVPELSRSDLIERSDVLFLMKGARLSPELLSDIIKKSKHIFTSDFFFPAPDEFTEVEKLLIESKSVFQVHNPFCYHPLIQWTGQNFPLPAYFDLNYAIESQQERDLIIKLLMLPVGFLGANPSKFRHMSLFESEEIHGFTNIRLEFSDSSVFNFNLSFQNPQSDFTLKVYSGKHILFGNLLTGVLEYDHKTIQPEKSGQVTELNDFFNSVSGKNPVKTGIAEYASILKIVREISRKNNWTET